MLVVNEAKGSGKFSESSKWLFVYLLLCASNTHAHVKWFVPAEMDTVLSVEPYNIADPSVLMCVVMLVIGLFVAMQMNALSEDSSRARRLSMLGRLYWSDVQRAASALFGISLLFSAFDGHLIAPHLVGGGPTFELLRVVEGLSGVLFLMGAYGCFAIALLLGVWLGIASLYGPLPALEYVSVPGVAIFLSSSCKPHWRMQRIHRLAVMRITLGLSLCTLALSEKLLNPGPAIELLSEQHFNFMAAMGFEFSDRLFVLSAGSVELLIGLCFLGGLSTRLTALALLLFLIASNSYFVAVGDMQSAFLEASGHALLFAAILPLLIYGRGRFSPGKGYMGAPVGALWMRIRSV